MREILLTQGKVALVDDDMFEELNQHNWYADWNGRHWYAARNTPRDSRGKHQTIRMHRVIMNAQAGQQVDHKDNEATLDNRRHNLRLCTSSQNHANAKKRAGCSSRFKGVTWHKRAGKWRAQITLDGKNTHLGYFSDETAAACAYNEAATEYFGEFARPNIVKEAAKRDLDDD